MIILFSFYRGYIAREKTGDTFCDIIKTELIKCRLIFKNKEELYKFLEIHKRIPEQNYRPEKITRWHDYMTATDKELGLK